MSTDISPRESPKASLTNLAPPEATDQSIHVTTVDSQPSTTDISKSPCIDAQDGKIVPEPAQVETQAGGRSRVRRASVVAKTSIRLWVDQFGTLLFSVVSLAALIGLLAGCDDREPPRIPWHMTLNALVSVLIGVLYISLSSPISSCLAQLKWNHFKKPKKLLHFQKIDFASRSVPGCVAIFTMVPFNSLAFLAAVLFLAIQAIGPFVQQIVSIELADKNVDFAHPTVPISNNWVDESGSIDLHGCEAGTACGLLHSFDASTRNPFQMLPLSPSCLVANCTWLPYWTLAVCGSCVDASEKLKVVNRLTGEPASITDMRSMGQNRWLLPNGHYLDPDINLGKSGMPVGNFINISATQSELFPETAGGTIMKMSVLATPLTVSPVVQECSLRFCGQQIDGIKLNGTFTETITKYAYFPASEYSWNEVAMKAANNANYQPSDIISSVTVNDATNQAFNLSINGVSFVGTTKRMTFALTGSLQVPDISSMSYQVQSTGSYGWSRAYDPIFNSMYNAIQEDWKPGSKASDLGVVLQEVTNRTDIQIQALKDRIDSIASTLTYTIRSGGNVTTGTGKTLQLRVRVDWRWITLPLMLFVLTVALLVGTIWDTMAMKMNVWSDDALATIVHGMDEPTQALLRDYDESRALSQAAREMKVRLVDVGIVKSLQIAN